MGNPLHSTAAAVSANFLLAVPEYRFPIQRNILPTFLSISGINSQLGKSFVGAQCVQLCFR